MNEITKATTAKHSEFTDSNSVTNSINRESDWVNPLSAVAEV
jgi:hypothetical protein